MQKTIDINTDELVRFSNKLERLNRSSLPKVVRNTLNTVAFDVKKNTMPKSANQQFVNRDKNFFKANSRVDMAKSNNINGMRSIVGFVSNNATKSNQAVEDLSIQERGGTISGRTFIPMNESRTSKSFNRMVAKRNRTRNLRNVVVSSAAKGANPNERFIKSAIHAGVGGIVVRTKAAFRIEKLTRQGNNTKVRAKAIYSYKKGRSVRVRGTRFFGRSVDLSAKKMDGVFVKNAKTEINKLMS